MNRGLHGRQKHSEIETFYGAGFLDAPWQALFGCVARAVRLIYIKDARSGLWATCGQVGFYPCQVSHDTEFLGCAIRTHGGVENRAHQFRDVTLGKDASRVRTRPGVDGPPPLGRP